MFFSQPSDLRAAGVPDAVVRLNGAERVVDVLSRKLGISLARPTRPHLHADRDGVPRRVRPRAVVMVNEHCTSASPEDAERLVDDLRARGLEALSGCHLCVEKKK